MVSNKASQLTIVVLTALLLGAVLAIVCIVALRQQCADAVRLDAAATAATAAQRGQYTQAAVAADHGRCSEIGRWHSCATEIR